MSKNGLHRHYDRLMSEERFRLDVLAMARGMRSIGAASEILPEALLQDE